jgi:hypothetical protein
MATPLNLTRECRARAPAAWRGASARDVPTRRPTPERPQASAWARLAVQLLGSLAFWVILLGAALFVWVATS